MKHTSPNDDREKTSDLNYWCQNIRFPTSPRSPNGDVILEFTSSQPSRGEEHTLRGGDLYRDTRGDNTHSIERGDTFKTPSRGEEHTPRGGDLYRDTRGDNAHSIGRGDIFKSSFSCQHALLKPDLISSKLIEKADQISNQSCSYLPDIASMDGQELRPENLPPVDWGGRGSRDRSRQNSLEDTVIRNGLQDIRFDVPSVAVNLETPLETGNTLNVRKDLETSMASNETPMASNETPNVEADSETVSVGSNVSNAYDDLESSLLRSETPDAYVESETPLVRSETPDVYVDLETSQVRSETPDVYVDLETSQVRSETPDIYVDLETPRVKSETPDAYVDLEISLGRNTSDIRGDLETSQVRSETPDIYVDLQSNDYEADHSESSDYTFDKESNEYKSDNAQSNKYESDDAQSNKYVSDDAQSKKYISDDAQSNKYLSYDAQSNKYESDDAQSNKYESDDAQSNKYISDDAQSNKYISDDAQSKKYVSDDAQPNKYLSDDGQSNKYESDDAQSKKYISDDAQSNKYTSNNAQFQKCECDDAQSNKYTSNDAQFQKCECDDAQSNKFKSEDAQSNYSQVSHSSKSVSEDSSSRCSADEISNMDINEKYLNADRNRYNNTERKAMEDQTSNSDQAGTANKDKTDTISSANSDRTDTMSSKSEDSVAIKEFEECVSSNRAPDVCEKLIKEDIKEIMCISHKNVSPDNPKSDDNTASTSQNTRSLYASNGEQVHSDHISHILPKTVTPRGDSTLASTSQPHAASNYRSPSCDSGERSEQTRGNQTRGDRTYVEVPPEMELSDMSSDDSEILDYLENSEQLGVPALRNLVGTLESEQASTSAAASTSSKCGGNVCRPTSLRLSSRCVPKLVDTSSAAPILDLDAEADLTAEQRKLGKKSPVWLPDDQASECMQCSVKFTIIKRRHHCRTCGKIFCSKCCSQKARIEYKNNAEERVCDACYPILIKVNHIEARPPQIKRPNPNNPMEYCSNIDPRLQVMGKKFHIPAVLVPMPPPSVLKRDGRNKAKPGDAPKQVMFSDGIRPGGDLTELDGSSELKLPLRRSNNVNKFASLPVSLIGQKRVLEPDSHSFIPTGQGLPPIATKKDSQTIYTDLLKPIKLGDEPVKFAINRNLYVNVNRVELDCCVGCEVWCMTSEGMSCVGQDEVVFILQTSNAEKFPPRDMFHVINSLYQDATTGTTRSEMTFMSCNINTLLGSKDHGGFLFIRATIQCTKRLILPRPPFLIGILVHRLETPWARMFPLRLMTRLGAEFRYYPCPIYSVRNRGPLYGEIGQTVTTLLVDFRKYAYTLPMVQGLLIHFENNISTISIPRNRYDQVMRALNHMDEYVVSFAGNYSPIADSHLVAMQRMDKDNSYETRAISVVDRPRNVTACSFIVFHTGLKLPGWSGKSSIVEDGLFIQITADGIKRLRNTLKDMEDYTLLCGPDEDETVVVKWVEDDRNYNIGVRSVIDEKLLDGIPSIRVHNGKAYVNGARLIKWTEVFVLQCDEEYGKGTDEMLNINRVCEGIAHAVCTALLPLLDFLATSGIVTFAVRTIIHPELVSYEAGSENQRFSPLYMKNLDERIIGVIHEAAADIPSAAKPTILESVFKVMELDEVPAQ